MSEYRISPIPVMPYVAAYYEKNGLDHSDRLMLQALLQCPKAKYDRSFPDYFGTLIPWAPVVPKAWLFDYGVELSPINARVFSNYLSAKIREKFEVCFLMELDYCRHIGTRFSIKNCLQRVRDNVVQLDEDSLLLETIIKHIQRWCKKNNVFYTDLLKFDRNNVLYGGSHSSRFNNENYIPVEEFCNRAKVGKTTFFLTLKSELETTRNKGVLMVKIA
jgi:hypothetical protein